MDNYEYKIYDAEHSTCGLGEMFGFLFNTFKNPPARPLRWDHVDVYPEFSVWDYRVSSDRNVPGFTILENVDERGFRCTVREFLPDGETLPSVKLNITTAALYEKNRTYIINDAANNGFKSFITTSDNSGRLQISLNGAHHEIGINRKDDKANICITAVDIENMNWATNGKDVSLSIKILNKGMSPGKKIQGTLSATRKSANVIQSQSEFGSIAV